MSDLQKVTGDDCLGYINRPIGFGSHDNNIYGNMSYNQMVELNAPSVKGDHSTLSLNFYPQTIISTTLMRWDHNPNLRVVGLVTDESPDGGLQIALLGDEYIQNSHAQHGGIDFNCSRFVVYGKYIYTDPIPVIQEYFKLDTQKVGGYCAYPNTVGAISGGLYENTETITPVDFDEAIDYNPEFTSYNSSQAFGCVWEYAGSATSGTSYQLTHNKNNTMVFGVITDFMEPYRYLKICENNPLNLLSGNLYQAISNLIYDGEKVVPERFPAGTDFDLIDFPFSDGDYLNRSNLTSIPFNIILTKSEQYAKAYLDDGVLPPDAFLYPLDWANLPKYEQDTSPDTPDDEPNDNTPDDNSRDITPNLPVTPTYTPSMLSNYNWYWLSVPDYSSFINWFWNDIGAYHDFDDLIAKVQGLYNDVASAVLMVRYFPVDIGWIGGAGTPSSIKLGMIEKSGTVDTISQASPPMIRDIGHVHISKKYKSFCDLAPYTQLSLYLPFHGFVDLDIDILMGHDLYVKGIYDYLTGTLQYLLYYDNEMLINSFIVKLAVDIPITLQTKNDRDSTVFQNVSSTVSGLLGAGAGIVSGNPIGMAIGVTQGVGALNSANASAPLNVRGTVGESGALYAPPQCAIILRRPTIQSSDKGSSLSTWKKNIGQLCGYGYTLTGLRGKGFTAVHSPRINFTKTIPLQSEVDEIYEYLEKGVIL